WERLSSEDYNLVKAKDCTWDGDQTGTTIGVDPGVGPLQNNGGSTLRKHWLPGASHWMLATRPRRAPGTAPARPPTSAVSRGPGAHVATSAPMSGFHPSVVTVWWIRGRAAMTETRSTEMVAARRARLRRKRWAIVPRRPLETHVLRASPQWRRRRNRCKAATAFRREETEAP